MELVEVCLIFLSYNVLSDALAQKSWPTPLTPGQQSLVDRYVNSTRLAYNLHTGLNTSFYTAAQKFNIPPTENVLLSNLTIYEVIYFNETKDYFKIENITLNRTKFLTIQTNRLELLIDLFIQNFTFNTNKQPDEDRGNFAMLSVKVNVPIRLIVTISYRMRRCVLKCKRIEVFEPRWVYLKTHIFGPEMLEERMAYAMNGRSLLENGYLGEMNILLFYRRINKAIRNGLETAFCSVFPNNFCEMLDDIVK